MERHHRVKQVSIEMLEARGYEIVEEQEYMVKGKNLLNQFINVFILTEEKLNIDVIKYYYYLFQQQNITHAIIVYKNTITSSAVRKILVTINTIRIELFSDNELMFNITKHRLVPKHRKVLPDKKMDLSKFPILKKTDPVARFYGYQVGNLIEITRSNGFITYRIVK
jgi:DNA-directed RNA polymerases I, II, and III subunit RPABC1